MAKAQTTQYGEPAKMSEAEERFNYSSSPWRDLVWLVLFLAHVAAVVTYAVWNDDTLKEKAKDLLTQAKLPKETEAVYIYVLGSAAATALVAALLWIALMRYFSKTILRVSFIVLIAVKAAVSFWALTKGEKEVAGVVGLSCFLTIVYFYLIRHRIAFSSLLLEMSSKAVSTSSSLSFLAIFVTLLGSVWFGVLGHVHFKLRVEYPSEDHEWVSYVHLLLLLSLFWTIQILQNIVSFTVMGKFNTQHFSYPCIVHSNGMFVQVFPDPGTFPAGPLSLPIAPSSVRSPHLWGPSVLVL